MSRTVEYARRSLAAKTMLKSGAARLVLILAAISNVATLIAYTCPVSAASSGFIMAGTSNLETSEANAAANLVGYHPVKDGKEQRPDPSATELRAQGKIKVTIIRIVSPAEWWSKYHWMVKAAAAQGREGPKGPSNDLDSLVEVLEPNGVVVWVLSSNVWLPNGGHPTPRRR